MKKLILLSLAGVISLFVLGLAATRADAYCVYNDTLYQLPVQGELCFRCYSSQLAPSGHGCCPGNHSGCRGKTRISVKYAENKVTGWSLWKHFGEKVTAHGWVRIKGFPPDLSGDVYDDHGALIWSGKLLDGE